MKLFHAVTGYLVHSPISEPNPQTYWAQTLPAAKRAARKIAATGVTAYIEKRMFAVPPQAEKKGEVS